MREAAGRRRRSAGLARGRRAGSPGWGVGGASWAVLAAGEKEMGTEPDSWEGRVCFWDGEVLGWTDPAVRRYWLRPTDLGNCLWEDEIKPLRKVL